LRRPATCPSYSRLRNLGRGQFFSVFSHFGQNSRPDFSFCQIASEHISFYSHWKFAVNSLLDLLFWFPNKIFTQKILISGRTAVASAFHPRLL
jgi:hypothetical protein